MAKLVSRTMSHNSLMLLHFMASVLSVAEWKAGRRNSHEKHEKTQKRARGSGVGIGGRGRPILLTMNAFSGFRISSISYFLLVCAFLFVSFRAFRGYSPPARRFP